MTHIANGVEWIDDLTFRTPSGKVYKMIAGSNGVGDCAVCDLNDPSTDEFCGLDTDIELKQLSCWGQSDTNSQSLTFYHIKKIDQCE